VQTWTVVVAAGSGARYGGAKQFEEVGARRLVDRAVDAATRAGDGVVVVLPAATMWDGPPVDAAVDGGATRSASVRSGLAVVPDVAEIVVVHDAARPLVTAALVDRCVERLVAWGCAGAIAAARATDTVKEADAGGRVIATLERANLWAIQTPQAFRAEALQAAFDSGAVDRAYDDAQLVEAAGGDVRIVEAPRDNLKVTTPFDLRVAELLLAGRD
jgi:2-C-methyl-D-erythritol 4-phosphate cytidylyltransferase